MADSDQTSFGGADPFPIPDDQDDQLGAEELEAGEMTGQGDGEAPAEDEEATDELLGDPPPEDDQAGQAAFKHWQAAYTKTRERDREQSRKLTDEHAQFRDVLANFYRDDAYALNVLRQRFPHLAGQMSGQQPTTGQSDSGTQNGQDIAGILQKHLSADLSFLAPQFAPAIEAVVNQMVGTKVQPLEQRITQQGESARKAEEDKLMAQMDGQYQGWEEKYGGKMRELDQFMASDALTHPEFGNKYEMFYRLLNPDAARVAAARGMSDAAKRRVTTGRTGSTPAPNIRQQMQKATNDKDAWDIAVRAAVADSGAG